MNDPERRRAEAAIRAGITAGYIDAASRWREVGELVASATDIDHAVVALTEPPFNYSERIAHHILDMPLRRLTHSARSEMVAELDEINTYLDQDGQDG